MILRVINVLSFMKLPCFLLKAYLSVYLLHVWGQEWGMSTCYGMYVVVRRQLLGVSSLCFLSRVSLVWLGGSPVSPFHLTVEMLGIFSCAPSIQLVGIAHNCFHTLSLLAGPFLAFLDLYIGVYLSVQTCVCSFGTSVAHKNFKA